MTSGRTTRIATVALAFALGVSALPAEAQRRPDPVGTFGLGFLGADPQGAMGRVVDDGWGGQLYGTWPLDRSGRVRIRGDLGFLIYGHERQRLCFGGQVGCRIEVDLNTTNSIAFGGLGPEVVLATGAVQPYLNGSVGFSWFATTSSISGSEDFDDFANTTNFSDAVLAWRYGGGLRIRVADGRRPVWIDLGLERHENGVAEYLTRGDIQDNPDGSITVFPTRSEADLLAFRLGVTIGIPRGGDDQDDRQDRRNRRW